MMHLHRGTEGGMQELWRGSQVGPPLAPSSSLSHTGAAAPELLWAFQRRQMVGPGAAAKSLPQLLLSTPCH